MSAHMTLATAEAASHGMVAHRLTTVPGSSAFFLGGIVLGTAVSWPGLAGDTQFPPASVAAMLRARLQSTLALCVGVAGDGVPMALCGPGEEAQTLVIELGGDRGRDRQVSSQVLVALEHWLTVHTRSPHLMSGRGVAL